MNRIRVALALMACVLVTPGVPAAAQPPIDQASWASLKKVVRLPNGTRLAYVEAGDPKGEPVLLLHGFTDSSRSFLPMVPYLSRYQLLIPDQRGHGTSDAPECCYGASQFAYDARLFLDALGVKRASVVGHSLGSMIAISLAAEYPERISKIVLIGSTALVPVKRGDWLYDNAAAVNGKLDPSTQFAKDWPPAGTRAARTTSIARSTGISTRPSSRRFATATRPSSRSGRRTPLISRAACRSR